MQEIAEGRDRAVVLITLKYAIAPFILLLSLAGCGSNDSAPAAVVASTPRGGIVRFSGNLVGDPIAQAQRHCFAQDQSAVPIGFYKIGPDDQKRDQVMTFECK